MELAGVPVSALAKKYGTALYVYSEQEVRHLPRRSACNRLNRALMRAQGDPPELKRRSPGGRPVDVFYAGKAFCAPQHAPLGER